jgi:hypothetical protein
VVLDGQHLEMRRSKQGLEFRIVEGAGGDRASSRDAANGRALYSK